MADTNVPAVDKASGLGPGGNKPPAGAPPSEGQPLLAVASAEAGHAGKPAERSMPPTVAESKMNGGMGHSRGPPRPVEVMSVPETPVNGSTPAGGTPRPELPISEEPAPSAPEPPREPAIEPVEMTGVEETTSIPATRVPDKKPAFSSEAPKPTSSGSELASAPREEPGKQQASGFKAPEPATAGSTTTEGMDIDEPEEKQAVPVTHTGPESEPVPAPAPAPATAPVAAPPPICGEQQPALFHGGPNDNAVGEKRKLDNAVPPVGGSSATARPPAEDSAAPDSFPPGKKPKLDENISSDGDAAQTAALVPEPDAASAADAASDPAPADTADRHPQTSPKNGRPKKEKKLPPVGKTARKTRSQGPADA
ncbi:uncharacterized protein MAM_05961 [Metarhizium album ARSEF 1941]|uniref:Uncharacterized protein n=1 Tax=Metarhizium album (strain ARSEF 1941) TaxID=1081103 RepID=A0A0B2WQ16_METAS|nr:uncharacterized protein MAM_05961 [Metarhizium album ARSEF 1941]KHN96113.1 hypothetical protein MAM_05961 [Metarhizium album ARSEF 1941]